MADQSYDPAGIPAVQVEYAFDRGQALPDGTFPVRCTFILKSDLASSEVQFILTAQGAEDMLNALRTAVTPLRVASTIEGNGT